MAFAVSTVFLIYSSVVEILSMEQVFVTGANWLHNFQVFISALFYLIKDWQFIIASLLILLSVVIFVKTINRQIRLQGLKFEDRRQRLGRVYRASMPEDLDAICAYALRSSHVMREAALIVDAKEAGTQNSPKGHQRRLRCPILPTLVLENLKGLVENLDEDDAEPIAELVVCYHTQHASLASALENFNQTNLEKISISKSINFNSIFKNTLELYLRARSILKFARRRTEEMPDTFDADDVLGALTALNIDNVMSPEAREYCLRLLSDKKL
jgi:hypothetical protein